MAYTVTASGTFHAVYGCFTINGTTYYAAGTWTFDSKPTVKVKVGATNQNYYSRCNVTLNGETVLSGRGDYTLETDDDIIDIVFTESKTVVISTVYTWWTAAITTSKTDPMAPKDGHNTNIGASAFQIESGTVRFSGAAYEIESGMTRVSGVAWEISFASKPPVITVTGTGNSRTCRVKINGEFYHEAVTVEVEAGTVIGLYSDNIHINGVLVATDASAKGHEYTVNGPVRIELAYSSKQSDNIYLYEE